MKEYFDVLTETGKYADRIETREECHSKGFWHKAVAIFIINSKNQVLLQKRSANKKLWPNLWDISAGRPCTYRRIWISSNYERN